MDLASQVLIKPSFARTGELLWSQRGTLWSSRTPLHQIVTSQGTSFAIGVLFLYLFLCLLLLYYPIVSLAATQADATHADATHAAEVDAESAIDADDDATK